MTASGLEGSSKSDGLAPASEPFSDFYDQTSKAAFSLALRISGDSARAEQACEAAYIDLLSVTLVDPAERQRTLLELVRRHSLALRNAEGQPDVGPTDSRTSTYNQKEILRAAMLNLTPGAQQAIEFAYFGGLRVREIAELTGSSAPSVRALLRDGLLTLSKLTRADAEVAR